jgi:hypothetical protein
MMADGKDRKSVRVNKETGDKEERKQKNNKMQQTETNHKRQLKEQTS